MSKAIGRASRGVPFLSYPALRCLLSVLIVFASTLNTSFAAAPEPAPIVAAASDLKFALEDIARQFSASTGRQIKLVFGSSGNFYQQIAQGAPFQLFMSADESFVLKLSEEGKTLDDGQLYAIGRIVLFAPHGSRLAIDEQLTGLKAAVAAGRIARFAIANPQHAPYGRAAEQVLKKAGVWDTLKPRLVLGENVSQAAQFASSGSADGGMFAYSLVLSTEIASRGRYVLIPQTLHQPLRQRMVLLEGAGQTARSFYRYLREPRARAVLARYGFGLPDRR